MKFWSSAHCWGPHVGGGGGLTTFSNSLKLQNHQQMQPGNSLWNVVYVNGLLMNITYQSCLAASERTELFFPVIYFYFSPWYWVRLITQIITILLISKQTHHKPHSTGFCFRQNNCIPIIQSTEMSHIAETIQDPPPLLIIAIYVLRKVCGLGVFQGMSRVFAGTCSVERLIWMEFKSSENLPVP